MKKLYLALFISILWTGTIFAAEEINGIMYNLDATTRTATVANVQYNQYYYSGAIVIPEQVSYNNRDYTVIGIDEQAFYQQKNLTSVVIPATVTSIGSHAFDECRSLYSVTIAEGCEIINEQAFNCCSALARINIPSSVKRIEEQAFNKCTNLAEITLNEGLTYIGEWAFYGLQKLKSITIPSTMEDMGRASFYNCTGLAKIVWKPVHCSDFTSAINAPFSSYYVGSYSSGHTEERNNWTTQITFGDEVEHIPAYLCYNFQGELRNLVIPDNVKSIGECAFAGCDKLVSMKLGAGLTEIGKNAFSDCTTLTQVSIPDNVTTINPSAFYGCTNLTTLTFGKGIQTLGTNAFGNGGKLTTINIYAVKPPFIDNTVFTNYSDLMAIDLNVREKALDAYKAANIWKNMHLGLVANDTRVFSLTVSSADNGKGSTTPSGNYDEGDNIVIGAMPKDGFHFTRWNDGNTENPRIINMTGDLTYTAYFAEGSTGTPSSNAYNVNILGENCTMNISSQYPEGSVVTMEAVPDDCLEFKQWSDGNKDNPRTVTVTNNGTYKAEFNKLTYTITVKSENTDGGGVNME